MYELMYLEINAICILILAFILLRGRKNIDKQAENLAFEKVVLATLVLHIIDTMWILIETKHFKFSCAFNYGINICYLFQTGVISYLWLNFNIGKLNKHKKFSIKCKILILLPLLVLLLICISSIWTKWLFYIDESNIYHRGPFHFFQMIIAYGYMIAAAFYSFYYHIKAKNKSKRYEALTLLSFVILPAIGGIISTIVYGLPISIPCVTLSLLMVYIDLQGHQISTDGLTGLNNRRQFDRYLYCMGSEYRKDKNLYLILSDIDSFKKINDTYGHREGDNALIQASTVLKKVCSDYNAFLARFGGDEFAILYHCSSNKDIKKLIESIKKELKSLNDTNVYNYTIDISFGYATNLSNEKKSVDDLIIRADKNLYEEKSKKKLMSIKSKNKPKKI